MPRPMCERDQVQEGRVRARSGEGVEGLRAGHNETIVTTMEQTFARIRHLNRLCLNRSHRSMLNTRRPPPYALRLVMCVNP